MSKKTAISILEGLVLYYENGIASEGVEEIIEEMKQELKKAKKALAWARKQKS